MLGECGVDKKNIGLVAALVAVVLGCLVVFNVI
jgi:hypothetical protein